MAVSSRWSELPMRALSAALLAALALATLVVGGWPFRCIWAFAGAAVAAEWVVVAHVERGGPARIAAPASVGIAGLLVPFGPWAVLGVLLAGLAVMVATGRTGRDRAWGALGVIYGAVLAVVPPLVRAVPEHGAVFVLWMFAVVWMTDIAAYFSGRTLGGPKLWPRVSPNKTWSGFVGGTLAGTVAATAVVVIGGVGMPWPLVALASLVASIAGQAGDLAESALKRHFDVKDSGHLIPGHGGFMDRLDAFWVVCVFAGLALVAAGGAA